MMDFLIKDFQQGVKQVNELLPENSAFDDTLELKEIPFSTINYSPNRRGEDSTTADLANRLRYGTASLLDASVRVQEFHENVLQPAAAEYGIKHPDKDNRNANNPNDPYVLQKNESPEFADPAVREKRRVEIFEQHQQMAKTWVVSLSEGFPLDTSLPPAAFDVGL